MKIEFGCGETPRHPEFKSCDVRDVPGVDFVCPAWEIDKKVKKNSVDEIFSRHFFEHLTFDQGKVVLSKWYKILKNGGRMEMILPNLDYHIKQWVSKSDLTHALAGFYGWQRGEFDDTWDTHKSGYNFDTLSQLLHENKFRDIVRLKTPKGRHLHIACFKR
jgi:predicted SAM-dependent methyltransferase